MNQCNEWDAFRHRAMIACEHTGMVMTPLREAVLQGLWRAESPRGAYGLTSELSEELGRRIGANSVYRILKLFSATGLVRRVESKQTYCIVGLAEGETDILIMCNSCGHATEVSANHVRTLLKQCSEAFGFQPSTRPIELAGQCRDCSQEANAEQ